MRIVVPLAVAIFLLFLLAVLLALTIIAVAPAMH